METTKLYYEDAYLREFDAAVLSCREEQGRYLVVLDRTAFYPEGGGQPADHGVLGGVAVTDVQERDGVVCHTCAGSLAVGSTVHGILDWQRRFDHMQQHSGEHIVSGMLCSAFHCDNVGFHMGTDIVTIDYNADIRWEQVLEVERQANRYIWEDHPCRVTFPSPAEREALPYRSKKTLTGAVRLTEFPGADLCACCGTHVSGSGQVGLVKFLSCQKFREGVRLELVCGGRAMAHLCRSWQQNRSIGQQLSVKPGDTAEAVERQGREILSLKTRCAGLEEDLFRLLAEQYRDAGEVLLVRHDLAGDGTRRLCDAVSRTCGGRCAVFSGEGERYQYAVIHPGTDLREFVKHMNDALHGRGGGRSGFAQGSVAADEVAIRAFFRGV